jgi:hypothetical protein
MHIVNSILGFSPHSANIWDEYPKLVEGHLDGLRYLFFSLSRPFLPDFPRRAYSHPLQGCSTCRQNVIDNRAERFFIFSGMLRSRMSVRMCPAHRCRVRPGRGALEWTSQRQPNQIGGGLPVRASRRQGGRHRTEGGVQKGRSDSSPRTFYRSRRPPLTSTVAPVM